MSTINERFHASLSMRSQVMAVLANELRPKNPAFRYFSAKSAELCACAGKSLPEILTAFDALRLKMEGIEAFTRPEQDSMSGNFDGVCEAAATARLLSVPAITEAEPSFLFSGAQLRGFEAEASAQLLMSQNLLRGFPEPHPIYWYFFGKVCAYLYDRDVPETKLRDKCKAFRWSSWVCVDERQRDSTRFHMLGVAAVMLELMPLNHRGERRQKLAERTVG